MAAAIGSLAALVLVADIVVKWLVDQWIGPTSTRHGWWLVQDLVGFEYARNSGAAFGMFQGNAEVLAAIALLVSIGFVWLIMSEVRSPIIAVLSAGLLVGGALGNMVERVALGYVTDFIALGPWPRFNVADSAITVGVVLFAMAVVFPNLLVPHTAIEGEDLHGG